MPNRAITKKQLFIPTCAKLLSWLVILIKIIFSTLLKKMQLHWNHQEHGLHSTNFHNWWENVVSVSLFAPESKQCSTAFSTTIFPINWALSYVFLIVEAQVTLMISIYSLVRWKLSFNYSWKSFPNPMVHEAQTTPPCKLRPHVHLTYYSFLPCLHSSKRMTKDKFWYSRVATEYWKQH